jgi:hypothetical protein
MHEQLRLLPKRYADRGFNEIFRVVDPVRHHDFERFVAAFGLGQAVRSRDWADMLRSVYPFVLARERPSKTATRTTYRFSQLNQPENGETCTRLVSVSLVSLREF